MKEITKTMTLFAARDGTVFNSPVDCQTYEDEYLVRLEAIKAIRDKVSLVGQTATEELLTRDPKISDAWIEWIYENREFLSELFETIEDDRS